MRIRGLFGNDDQRLVREFLRTGDERSFRELYKRHTPRLYPLAIRLTGSEADAQDAIQETWIRACQSLEQFEWRSTIRTWLTGILINCAREKSREQRRYDEMPDGAEGIDTTSLTERVDLEQIIRRLPTGYRHVLTLHDVEGYTHEEICELLKISAGTSKSQLHHARKALRFALREEG